MKVEIKISADAQPPYAIIYTDEVTKEVQDAVSALGDTPNVITAMEQEKIVVLQPQEIYMIQVVNEQVNIYCQTKKYVSTKRLYQLAEQLGKDFMQISRFTIINLKTIECVEPSFNGLMNIRLKNDCSDYISRKYLPNFKKYLGI